MQGVKFFERIIIDPSNEDLNNKKVVIIVNDNEAYLNIGSILTREVVFLTTKVPMTESTVLDNNKGLRNALEAQGINPLELGPIGGDRNRGPIEEFDDEIDLS